MTKIVTKLINTTEALILGSLHSGPKSGAQIIELAHTIDGFWTCTRSQVYREIRGLEKREAIKPVTENIPPPNREQFSITKLGRKLYQDWIDKATPKDHIRSEWILRLMLTEHDGTDRMELAASAIDAYELAGTLETTALRAAFEANDDADSRMHGVLEDYFSLMTDLFKHVR